LSLAVTGHQARRAKGRRTDPPACSVLIGTIRYADIQGPVGELEAGEAKIIYRCISRLRQSEKEQDHSECIFHKGLTNRVVLPFTPRTKRIR
jgi:hypothetical protein